MNMQIFFVLLLINVLHQFSLFGESKGCDNTGNNGYSLFFNGDKEDFRTPVVKKAISEFTLSYWYNSWVRNPASPNIHIQYKTEDEMETVLLYDDSGLWISILGEKYMLFEESYEVWNKLSVSWNNNGDLDAALHRYNANNELSGVQYYSDQQAFVGKIIPKGYFLIGDGKYVGFLDSFYFWTKYNFRSDEPDGWIYGYDFDGIRSASPQVLNKATSIYDGILGQCTSDYAFGNCASHIPTLGIGTKPVMDSRVQVVRLTGPSTEFMAQCQACTSAFITRLPSSGTLRRKLDSKIVQNETELLLEEPYTYTLGVAGCPSPCCDSFGFQGWDDENSCVLHGEVCFNPNLVPTAQVLEPVLYLHENFGTSVVSLISGPLVDADGDRLIAKISGSGSDKVIFYQYSPSDGTGDEIVDPDTLVMNENGRIMVKINSLDANGSSYPYKIWDGMEDSNEGLLKIFVIYVEADMLQLFALDPNNLGMYFAGFVLLFFLGALSFCYKEVRSVVLRSKKRQRPAGPTIVGPSSNRSGQNQKPLRPYSNSLKHAGSRQLELPYSKQVHDLVKSVLLQDSVTSNGGISLNSISIKRSELKIFRLMRSKPARKVYEGRYKEMGVAVKMFHAATANEIWQLHKDARLQRTLHHPNIVLLVGICFQGGFFTIHEFVERGNLHQLLANTKHLSWHNPKWKMAVDIARGMLYLHSTYHYDEFAAKHTNCIIHRNLNSRNILVTHQYGVKLREFSPSRPLLYTNSDKSGGPALSIAPEILRGEEFDEKVDVFSYAICLLEMMQMGPLWDIFRHAFLQKHSVKRSTVSSYIISNAVTFENLRPIVAIEGLQSLCHLMEMCWHPDPSFRPTFKQILTDLEEIIWNEIFCYGGMIVREQIFTDDQKKQEEEESSAMLALHHSADSKLGTTVHSERQNLRVSDQQPLSNPMPVERRKSLSSPPSEPESREEGDLLPEPAVPNYIDASMIHKVVTRSIHQSSSINIAEYVKDSLSVGPKVSIHQSIHQSTSAHVHASGGGISSRNSTRTKNVHNQAKYSFRDESKHELHEEGGGILSRNSTRSNNGHNQATHSPKVESKHEFHEEEKKIDVESQYLDQTTKTFKQEAHLKKINFNPFENFTSRKAKYVMSRGAQWRIYPGEKSSFS